jgi:hypothetical protein
MVHIDFGIGLDSIFVLFHDSSRLAAFAASWPSGRWVLDFFIGTSVGVFSGSAMGGGICLGSS